MSERSWCGGLSGLGARAELYSTGGLDELPDADCGEENCDRPEDDQDGEGPAVGELIPEMEDGFAVVDAEPGGDDVTREAAEGEGSHELAAVHLNGASGEDEGREWHGRRKN